MFKFLIAIVVVLAFTNIAVARPSETHPYIAMAMAAGVVQKRLRYHDLLALGIVRNRVTLKNWIRDRGFPQGQRTGPNSRTWGEAEVQQWLDSRPTAPQA